MSITQIIFAYLFLAAVWGASFMFMRIGVPEFGVYVFSSLRVTIAGLLLLPFLFSSQRFKEVRHAWLRLSIIGFISTGLPFLLFSFALQSLSASVGSVINAAVPIITGIIAYMFFHEKLSVRQWLGLIVGLIGVSVLMWDGLSQGSAPLKAFLAALGACSCYAIGGNLTKHYLSNVSAITTAASGLTVSGLLMLPLMIWWFPKSPISLTAWSAALGIAALSTAVAMVMFYALIKALGPTKTVTITLVIPVFGIFWGMLLLDEQLTFKIALGSLIILCGTALSILPQKKPT